MDTLFYFAYGSNMSTRRLSARVPSARLFSTARLERHCLAFHKRGQDGSAKCDALFTDHPDDFILGTVYEILEAEREILDRIEGIGKGYESKIVAVTTERGNIHDAYTYFATDIDKSLQPFDWYKSHVLYGAMEHGLPGDYIEKIEAIAAMEDSDILRSGQERDIHAKGK